MLPVTFDFAHKPPTTEVHSSAPEESARAIEPEVYDLEHLKIL